MFNFLTRYLCVVGGIILAMLIVINNCELASAMVSWHDNLDGWFEANISVDFDSMVELKINNMNVHPQFHGTSIVIHEGVYYAYYIDHLGPAGQNEVGLAISSDGINFTKVGTVVQRGPDKYDEKEASFPFVDIINGQWIMTYEARTNEHRYTVAYATSNDGINWEKHGPIIEPWDAGPISSCDVGTPTFYYEDGTYHVFFHTNSRQDWRVRIGYASGPSLDRLTVKNGALIDVAYAKEDIEGGTVGARSKIIKKDGYYYMAYEVCSWTPGFNTSIWGSSLARSKQLDSGWKKYKGNPILTFNGTFTADTPDIIKINDDYYLIFRYGGNQTGRMKLNFN